jgi:monoamine oxidase
MNEVDIAIVGAGAAGLAAAEAVAASGRSGVLLEARDRLGGRGHTIASPVGPLDLGCEWLHSADHNPLVARFQALGLTIDKTPPPWANLADSPTFSREERAQFGEAFLALDGWKRPPTTAAPTAPRPSCWIPPRAGTRC